MLTSPVLAHGAGVDDIVLLIALPAVLYFSIRWFTRRAEGRTAEGEPRNGPPGGGPAPPPA